MADRLTNNQQRQSMVDYGSKTESPDYADWAKRQQHELDQRRGDGYSAMEGVWDALAGAPQYAAKNIRVMMDAPAGTYGKLDNMMDDMRSIADAQHNNPKMKLSPQQQGTVNAWELMRTQGKLPIGY